MVDSLNIKTYTKFIDWGSNDIINLEGIQLMISIKRPEHIFKNGIIYVKFFDNTMQYCPAF